jgi:predicted nucleic acid-binding protein
MMLVMDSSAALKWYLPEPFADKAKHLLDDYQHGTINLIAPDIFAIETLHALAKAERQKRITSGAAHPIWLSIMSDCPVLHSHLSLLDRAYEIAAAAHIGIYDCTYVALAEREDCELATADDRLIRNLQATFAFIRHLSTFP